jgi:hypothetical protein
MGAKLPSTHGVTLPVRLIKNANPAYVRRDVLQDAEYLKKIKQSIVHEQGLRLPILITPDYQVIDGAVRLEAYDLLGWPKIEVIIAHDWETVKQYFLRVRELEAGGFIPKPMRWMDQEDLIQRILKPLYAPVTKALMAASLKRMRNNGPMPVATPGKLNSSIYGDLQVMFGESLSMLEVLRDIKSTIKNGHRISAQLGADLQDLAERSELAGDGRHSALALVRKALKASGKVVHPADLKVAADQVERIERIIGVLRTLAAEVANMGDPNDAMDPETALRLAGAIRSNTRRIHPLYTLLAKHAAQLQERENHD